MTEGTNVLVGLDPSESSVQPARLATPALGGGSHLGWRSARILDVLEGIDQYVTGRLGRQVSPEAIGTPSRHQPTAAC